MKKVFLFLAAALFVLSACEGPAGRDGLDGEGANWFVKNYQVKSNQWQLIGGQNDLNSYWQAEVVIPELTKFVYEKGNVFCYMFQNPDGNTEVQTLLPFVVPYGQITNGNEYIWTETYACDFTVGSVMFYVNYSDFMTNNRPLDATFRVVFNW